MSSSVSARFLPPPGQLFSAITTAKVGNIADQLGS
jgi:hypothetical protein